MTESTRHEAPEHGIPGVRCPDCYVGTCDTCRTAHPCTTRQAMAEALEER